MLHSLKTRITYTPSLYRKYSLCFLFIVDIFIIFYSEWLWCWWNSVTVLLCLTACVVGFAHCWRLNCHPFWGLIAVFIQVVMGCCLISIYPISLLFQNHFPVFTCMFSSIHGIQINQIQISGMFLDQFWYIPHIVLFYIYLLLWLF